MTYPESEIRRMLRLIYLEKRCKAFEEKVNRLEDGLIDIASGCDKPDERASKALLG